MSSDISPQHVNMTGPTTPPPASTPQPPPTPILLVEDVDVPPCPSPRGSEALAIPHIASLVTSHIPDEYLSCVATVRKSWFAIVAPRLYTTVRITHPDVASTHTVPNATLPSAGEMGLILPWPLKQLVSGVIKKKHVRAALPGVAWARQTAFRAIKTLVVPLHSDARCSQEAMGELHEMLEGNFRLRLPRFIVTTDPGLHLACPFIPAFDPVEIVARCDGLCNGLTYRSTGGTAPTVSDRWPCRTKRVIIEPDVKCYSYHPCLYPASIDTYVYRLDGYRPIPGASLPLATSFNSVRHVAHTLESRLQATVIVLDPDDSAQQMSDARANPTITTSSSSSTLLQEKRGPVRNLFAETLSVHMKAHSGPLRCERVRYMEPRDYRQFVLEMDGTDALWK